MDAYSVKMEFDITPGDSYAECNVLVRALQKCCYASIFGWYLALDYFLSNFISTTVARKTSENFALFIARVRNDISKAKN